MHASWKSHPKSITHLGCGFFIFRSGSLDLLNRLETATVKHMGHKEGGKDSSHLFIAIKSPTLLTVSCAKSYKVHCLILLLRRWFLANLPSRSTNSPNYPIARVWSERRGRKKHEWWTFSQPSVLIDISHQSVTGPVLNHPTNDTVMATIHVKFLTWSCHCIAVLPLDSLEKPKSSFKTHWFAWRPSTKNF